ncbi:TonB-dependent receptor [soil metagenome]
MRFNAILRASASAAVLAACAAGAAHAQSAAPPPSDNSVDAIIVTAQRRAQNLEDVPIVVTVVSAQQIRDAGIKDIKDLTILTPGLTVSSTTSETVTTARIRGIGTVGDNPGLEASVGVLIDNVYRPRNGVSFGDLGEIERIEVLKGPQGTLFGKSTSAGVINVLTAQPKFVYGANAEFTAGNYGAVGGSASVTGPLVEDKLAGRLFIAARKRDGFYDVNIGNGPRTLTEDQNQEFATIRGQLLATPTPNLDIRAIVDFTTRDESCCVAVQLNTGFNNGATLSRNTILNQVHPGATGVTDPYARVAYSNRPTDQRITDFGGSIETNWRTPWGGALTAITGLRNWRSINGQDADFSDADLLYRPTDGRNGVAFRQFSQELRYSGEVGRLNYLVGAFYANERLTREDTLLYGADLYSYFAGRVLGGAPGLIGVTPGTALQSGGGVQDHYQQNDDTTALFTNDTFAITKKWDVTFGLRYTNDHKTLDEGFHTTSGSCTQGQAGYAGLVRAAGAATAGAVTGGLCLTFTNQAFDCVHFQERKLEDQLSGTLKSSYRFTSDYMAYVSYAHGYKAGGFNLDRTQRTVITATGPTFVPVQDTSFKPEKADSYEVGTKLQFFRKSLLVNLTAFYQTFDDFQLNIFLGTSFTVKDIPRVNSHGADFDVYWRTPVEGLSFQGGLTYAETQYSETRPADTDFTLPPAGSVVGGALYRLPGSRLSFAPKYSASLSGTYEHPLFGDFIGRLHADTKYTSSYNTGSDLQPLKVQKEFFLVNARVSVGPKSERYSVEFWAQNLFDKGYKQVAFNGTLQGTETDAPSIRTYDAFLGAPRTFGATIRAKY